MNTELSKAFKQGMLLAIADFHNGQERNLKGKDADFVEGYILAMENPWDTEALLDDVIDAEEL